MLSATHAIVLEFSSNAQINSAFQYKNSTFEVNAVEFFFIGVYDQIYPVCYLTLESYFIFSWIFSGI